ncbi:MAG TPA: hypothetical protein VMW57_05230 [Methyloceanibacter sp.]|nr:hypothetical protein [Methyloceanibacter sp.]
MPAGYDAEVAALFRDLRAASSLSETDLAAQIAAPIEVVKALEQGALYALPPWPETCRVVNAYGTLLNLDTRPLLRRIYAQIEAGIVELRPKTMPDVPVMAPPGGSNSGIGGGGPTLPDMPQAPAWPNGQQVRSQPQAPWPSGAPQMPQGGMAGMPRQAAQAPRAPSPQAPASPNGAPAAPPQARPAPPQQQPRPPQALPSEPQGFPPDPHGFEADAQGFQPDPYGLQPDPQDFQPDPQDFQPDPQGYQHDLAAEPQPLEDASFLGEPEPVPAPARAKKPALLKWGIGALIASVIGFGLWMALSDSSGPTSSSGSFNTSDPVLDPDDPRSRKADKLPNNF